MLIKEIENLSGMDRANIRFYEREGFINPKRLSNGYRDYSENDLQTLLRIKLLRSLHISLEDIGAIKSGHIDLAHILNRQVQRLEQEKEDVGYAKEICNIIQGENTEFNNLDAKKYLVKLEEKTQETGSKYFNSEDDKISQVKYPWRRFLARMLDLYVYGILWSAFLVFAFQKNISTRNFSEEVFNGFFALALMLIIEPLLLHYLGSTPGKAIFGLSLESLEARPLTYMEGLNRTWTLVGKGMGYGIPIYNLYRYIDSYNRLTDDGMVEWDGQYSYTIKDRKWYRGLLYIGVLAISIATTITIGAWQQLPPNRGDMTIGQFAENYNYYARYYEISNGTDLLDENGQWTKNDIMGSGYYFGGQNKPNYEFIEYNGYITGLSYEIEGMDDLRIMHDKHILLSSLAFGCGQKELGLFSKIPRLIYDQVNRNTYNSYEKEYAGITFTYDIKYQGYEDAQSYFMAQANGAEEVPIIISFSMRK